MRCEHCNKSIYSRKYCSVCRNKIFNEGLDNHMKKLGEILNCQRCDLCATHTRKFKRKQKGLPELTRDALCTNSVPENKESSVPEKDEVKK